MRRLAILFGACLLLVAIVYRHAPSAFLRAESGLWLRMAHADATAQQEFTRRLLTESYNGHYTPLFFLGEFETAKIAGTNRAFWRWRQILAVAVLAAVSVVTLTTATKTSRLARRERVAIAAAIAALAVFHPLMIDFVSWPFMIAQLCFITLMMVSLFSLLKMVHQPNERHWPWIAAGAAYLSMHFLGLGLIVVASVLASFVALIIHTATPRRIIGTSVRKRVIAPTILLASAALVHAWLMIHLMPRHAAPGAEQTVHFIDAVKLVLGFVFQLAWTGLRSFSLAVAPPPNVLAIAYCWPFGLLLVIGVCLLLWKIARSRSNSETSGHLAVMVIGVFSTAGFFALVLLMTAREIAEAPPASGGVVPFFNAFLVLPRYAIPLQFLFVAPAALAVAAAAKFSPRLTTYICSAVVVAAAIAQLEFQASPMKSVMTGTRISHHSVWQLVLATARECRAAGLPMPNVSLAALTEEAVTTDSFSTADIRSFMALIRRDLHLRADEKLELADNSLGGDDPRYASVPSLAKLERMLNLRAPEE